MKSVIIILALFLFSSLLQAAELRFSGAIKKDTRWSGTVVLTGDVVVSSRATLTIEPGTKILALSRQDDRRAGSRSDRIELTILGQMIAKGKPDEGQIVFSSASDNPLMQDWYGIRFRSKGANSILEYCLVEFAYNGIECNGSSPNIRYSTIRYNFQNGILCDIQSNPLIASSMLIENGMAGLFCEFASRPLVENSIISRNRQGVVIFETSRPDLGQLVEEAGRSIGENRIFGNDEHDIYSRSSERIFAQNNYWNSNNLEQIRRLIEIVPGEDSKAGEILIEPFLEHNPLLAANLNTPPPATRSSRTVSPKKSVKKPETKQPASQKRKVSKPPLTKPKSSVASLKSPVKDIPSNATSKPATEKVKSVQTVEDKAKIVLLEPEEPANNQRTLNPTHLQRPGEPIIEMMLDNNEREYIERKRPNYPSVYLASGVEGIVLVEVFVGKDGRIDRKRVLRSDGDAFTEAAEEALKSYRYKPGTINGVPVPYRLVERFTFEIE